MCPIYQYKNKKTGKIIEEIISVEKRNEPIILPNGEIYERIEVPSVIHGWKGNREVFELDREYVRKSKPKYVKFRDGHRELYDSTRHN